ncbi:plasmid pRiA4b ORF-3 family protein [Planococcus sp. YIM B11945]|uniref:plasmid pRiA4b ORF-3 family protein n=1 Tax=Planococcus sp. YIM B11945 TaxID=3435410 RepID=UPI003D7C6F8A
MKAYILTIQMIDMEPPVWRRIVLPAGVTFQRLHAVIQNVTNFQSEYMDFPQHFHEFRLPEENLLITNEPDIYEKAKKKKTVMVRKPQSTKIDVFLEKYGRLEYRYDFGDNWEFEIQLEEIVDDFHFGYPVLLDGAGDAPPEDVGGVHGFRHMLAVLADKTHSDHEHMLWWSKEQRFRPYDRGRINGFLREMKLKKTEWDKINHENYRIISDKYYVEDEKIAQKPLPDGFEPKLFLSYVDACTNLYGVVPLQKIIDIFNKQNSKWYLNLNQVFQVLNGPEREERAKTSIATLNGLEFAHAYVLHEDAKDQILKEQGEKDWHVPNKSELLRYADAFYIE